MLPVEFASVAALVVVALLGTNIRLHDRSNELGDFVVSCATAVLLPVDRDWLPNDDEAASQANARSDAHHTTTNPASNASPNTTTNTATNSAPNATTAKTATSWSC